MRIKPTLITASLAGILSALVWPAIWSRFGGAASSGSLELILGTLLVVALPAHAFVVGFKPSRPADARALDTALLKRVGSWLLAGAITAVLASAYRSS